MTTIRYAGADLYPKQRAAIFDPARISIVEASTKSGKAQPLDSLVYTPMGPVSMGSIAVGDEVLTPTGIAKVRAIHPQGEQPIFRVTFADRSSVRCTADHLWEIDNCLSGGRGAEVVDLETIRHFPESRLTKTYVPPIKPASYDWQDLAIPPYLLGVLIGDGGLKHDRVYVTSADPEILARVSESLDGRFYELQHLERHDYAIAVKVPYQLIPDSDRLGFQLEMLGLKGLGSHEKFVPDCYRYNSEEMRWLILQGILDTDGWVNSRGQPMLEQTSPQLALNVAELVESLGGYTRTTTKVGSYRDKLGRRVECRTVYRQAIVHPDAPRFFSLTRKRERCTPKKKNTRRYFKSIEPDGVAEAQCIELDDPRGLYLTDNLIPTHNTVGCLAWLLEQALQGKPDRNYWWCAPVFGQAEIGFRRMCAKLPASFYRKNQSKLTIRLANGTTLWFKSAERPDDLYGEDVWAAVLDEASRMREEAWHAVRSTLTQTKGPVRIIGNVKGRKNWFYRMARAAEEGAEGMAFHRINAWDAVEAGVLERAEIEASYRDFQLLGKEGAWNQLYMAEAAEDGDNPFGLTAIANCVTERFSIEPARAAGVDLAGRGAINVNPTSEIQERDYTAVALFDRNGDAIKIVRFRKPHTETTAEVAAIVKRTPALVDSTGTGDAVVENLQRRGDMAVEGFTFTERSRQELLEGLALAIGEQGIGFPDGWWRDELDSFEYRYTARGVKWVVPEGMHDDGAMALALAVKKLPWRLKHLSAPMGVPKSGGSAWLGGGGQQVDPLKSPGGTDAPVTTEALPVPFAVSGPSGGKWRGH